MKKFLFLSFFASLFLTACNDDTNEFDSNELQQSNPSFDYTRADFPKDDGSPKATGTIPTIAARLLLNADVEFCTDTVGHMYITDESSMR